MKMAVAIFLLAICLQVSIAEIIPIPGKFVDKHPFPNHGECFQNTEILCDEAMKVQYDAENCVDCTCNGDGEGVICCNLEPFPVVRKKESCDVRLNTTSCLYSITPKDEKHKHDCCINGYEIADIEWTPEKQHPGRPGTTVTVNKVEEKVDKDKNAEKAGNVKKT